MSGLIFVNKSIKGVQPIGLTIAFGAKNQLIKHNKQKPHGSTSGFYLV
jgi:hypothetical protein